MKILAVIHTPKSPYSAVHLNYVNLGAPFEAAGHTLSILAPEDFPALRRRHARWYPLLFPWHVAAWLRRHPEYDLVSFHSYAGWLANLRGLYRGRTVTAFHGLEPLNYAEVQREMTRLGRPYRWRFRLLHGTIVPALIRLSCRRSALVLCLNEEERRFLVESGWSDAARTVVVGHGVSDEFFLDRGYADRARRLLFVGQWIPRKGGAYLAEACGNLMRARPDLELSCVGTLTDPDVVLGDFAPEIRARITVHPQVPRERLPEHYAQADVFLFPSLVDGFGLALLEAMASGLPIVTTPAGWAQDVLADGESCLLVPKRDAGALVHAVERLLDDAPLRTRLGGGAQAAARVYHLDRVAADRLAILQRLLPADTQPQPCAP